jgi:hypothetical protein
MSRAFDATTAEGHTPRWDALIRRAIQLGRDEGELRADVDPARAAEVLTGVYYATVYMWVNCGDIQTMDFDLTSEIRARLELVLDGLATAKRG